MIESRDGCRYRRVDLERDSVRRTSIFGRMVAAHSDLRAVPDTEALFAALGRCAVGAPGRAVRQRRAPHSSSTTRREMPSPRLRPDFDRARAVRGHRSQLHRESGGSLEVAHVLRRARRTEDRSHRLRSRSARMPRLPPRSRAVGNRDRDLPGRRDRTAVDAVRAGRGKRCWIERVEVGGRAVVVARGEFRLDRWSAA